MNNAILTHVLPARDFNYAWRAVMCEVFDFKIWIHVKAWFDNVTMFSFAFENDF